MSNYTDRVNAPRADLTTVERLAAFAELGEEMGVTPPAAAATNTFAFGEGQAAQMARMSGMHAVDDSFNNADISEANMSPEEKAEKRRKEVMQKFVTMSIVDQMIEKIDLRLEEIGNKITALDQDNVQIGIDRQLLTAEQQQTLDESERLKGVKVEAEARTPEVEQAVIDAEQANADALIEQERAQRALLSANSPDDVIRCTHAIEVATEKVQLTTEELDLRREQAMTHVTNLEELDQGVLALETRLEEIERELGTLDTREASNNASIAELKIEQNELLEAKDKLQNDEEFRAKVEGGEYTVQEVMDEMPPAAQETFSQQLDGWINTATDAAWNAWSGVKSVASDALDTVVNAADSALTSVTTTASAAADAVVNTGSDMISSAKMTISGYLTSEPDPTGDRAPANAAAADFKAEPPTTIAEFNAGGLNKDSTPAIQPTPIPTPAPVYAELGR